MPYLATKNKQRGYGFWIAFYAADDEHAIDMWWARVPKRSRDRVIHD